jgi:hypothetical protein
MSDKIRKEIQLTQVVLDNLQFQADKDGRSLKNYMEQILIKQSEKTSK